MRNFIVNGNSIIVTTRNGEYELEATPELLEYYTRPGCTCRMVPIEEINVVIVGGQDDCPVHGFGCP